MGDYFYGTRGRGTDDYLIKEYNRTRNKNAIDNWIRLGGIGSKFARIMDF